ncbi:hypothetical protein OH807_19055 [Kitasatospora sp. NBC_01560]|uniref:hypothetical protein n=1 Tax=Kitasatospora sp. NBC_01560 TaxID=2975965 RepID=UPI00386F3209
MTTPLMTRPTTVAPTVALRAALQFYPARYRRERGEELAAVFADTTAEAGRPAVAREAVDLALYGLRVRLGLTSASVGGQVLALAAPMIAGAVVGAALMPWVTDADAVTWRLTWDRSVVAYAGLFVLPVAALLLVVAALLGRWRAARVTALLAALPGLTGLAQAVRPGGVDWWWAGYVGASAMPFALAALLLAAAPGELLPRPTWRTAGLVLASVAGGGLLAAVQRWDDTLFPVDVQWFVLLLLAPLLLTFTALRGRVAPAAVGVAVLTLTAAAGLFNIWREAGGVSRLLPVTAPVVLVLLLAAAVLRRSGAGRGSEVRGSAARNG